MVQTVSRAVLLALIPALAYSGISYSQTTLDSIRALQEHRNELFQKISPGIVSIELVHRSLPAWELAQIERWANEFRLQPWRFGNLSDEESELWRNWCDAFLMEMENRISKGKIDAGSESPSNLKDFLHDNLQEWQARERTFLVSGNEDSFDRFTKAIGEQVVRLHDQVQNFSFKPLPVRQMTGFIVDKGIAVTTLDIARHKGPYDNIRVWSDALVQYSTGEVIGQDPETNVAVIRLASPGSELLPTINFNSDKATQVGDFVYAFWHAFSQPLSMRTGEVTGVLRKIPFFHCATFLETSLPTSPGTLGAPLVNLDGDFVGMGTVYMAQGSMTEVTFALPSLLLLSVVDQIRKDGIVKRGKLGVFVNELADSGSDGKKVVVKEVEPNSTAARHGLQVGDVIKSVNDVPIHCKMHLLANLSRFKPTDEIVLTIDRHGQPTRISLDLDPMP